MHRSRSRSPRSCSPAVSRAPTMPPNRAATPSPARCDQVGPAGTTALDRCSRVNGSKFPFSNIFASVNAN